MNITKEQFDKFSLRKQRVLIAKDILARVDKKLLRIERGDFIHSPSSVGDSLYQLETAQNAANTKMCIVCAKGALSIAWIGNFNRYTQCDFGLNYYSYNHGTNEIVATFGRLTFDVLEILFENWKIAEMNLDGESDQFPKLIPYWRDIKATFRATTAVNQLKSLFQNIIDNKGVLKFKNGLIIDGDKVIMPPAKTKKKNATVK